MAVSPLLSRYDRLLLDLDGCVWVGGIATPRAPEAVAAARAAGIRVAYVTNDARHGTEDFVRQLWSQGFQASLEEVVTVGGALQHVLADEFAGAAAVVIGAPAVHRHVLAAGLRIVNGTDLVPRAQVVVVAGHEQFGYAELREAARAVSHGAVLLGAARDPTYPQPDGPWPGTGAILAAVEVAGGAKARTIGKPMPQLFLTALDRLGAGHALVVGDRVDADLAGAHAAGLDGAIVLTGTSTREQALAAVDPRPVAVADTFADLVLAGA